MISINDINNPETLKAVTAAFYRYEQALISNDIAVLDQLFLPNEFTIRYGATENLYGYAAIQAFRKSRPASGLERSLQNTVITTYGTDIGCCSTEFTREGSPRIGRQQQTWVNVAEGWRIAAAHVSLL